MAGARFAVRRNADDAEALEAGLTHLVWDAHKGRPYGWYTCFADADESCRWLNATGGKVD